MKLHNINPRALIQQAVKDAEKAVTKANEGNTLLSQADYGRLPSGLKALVDEFKAGGQYRVKTNDILEGLKTKLETSLAESLRAGQLLEKERDGALGLLTGTTVGVQMLGMLEAAELGQGPKGIGDAVKELKDTLRSAGQDHRSQIGVFKSLARAVQAFEAEDPTNPHLKTVKGLADQRGKLIKQAADTAVSEAEKTLQQSPGDPVVRRSAHQTFRAAQEVHAAVNPKSVKVRTLQNREKELGLVEGHDAKAKQPFFARFLEGQEGGPAAARAQKVTAQKVGAEKVSGQQTQQKPTDPIMVTKKAPSDHEDGGGGDPIMVTMKAPSDHEDGGEVGEVGGVPPGQRPVRDQGLITQKDGQHQLMSGGVAYEIVADSAAAKKGLAAIGDAPVASAALEGRFGHLSDPSGGPDRKVFFATAVNPNKKSVDVEGTLQKKGGEFFLKAADGTELELLLSSAQAKEALQGFTGEGLGRVTGKVDIKEDPAGGPDRMTLEVSQAEVYKLGVTRKFPSDAEDGGEEPGVVVTMKAPSDEEDSGTGGGGGIGPITTEKAPSDAEDSGEADGELPIFVTMKAPSDHEDGGDGGVGDGGAVTERFPSDAEDVGDVVVTMKAPSDHEDGGDAPGGPGDDVVVTMKAPSDAEDGGDDGVGDGGAVTERFPSDNEDIGDGGDPGDLVTLKFPSDAEDGGDGGVDDGGMVTMKAPSDHEDGGDGGVDDPGDVATAKFPSDAEDGGVDNGDSAVTERFPSDAEDTGDDGGMMVTMKFPSDNEDGAGDVATAKFPSDAEDGGDAPQ